MATVGLCMIVRNETHVIERCLASLRDRVDRWCIVDTGSTDDTREKIRGLMAGIPGEIHERPWKDFGHNRSEALALARPHADYSFMIDADEEMAFPPGFAWPDLAADSYMLLHATGSNRYWRSSLFSNRLAWRYAGVLHEYAEAPGAGLGTRLEGPVVWGFFDGGRSVGLSQAEKYERDARTLEEALAAEPDNARYQFYLAQSYRDAGLHRKAIDAYVRRAEMGGWAEEVWYSLQQVAVISEWIGAPEQAVVHAYLKAYGNRPVRAEPLVRLAAYLRDKGQHVLAHLYASRAKDIPRPEDILFLDDDTYAWRALDEYSISAYWVGDRAGSAAACERLLASPLTPEAERSRIRANLAYARGDLAVAS